MEARRRGYTLVEAIVVLAILAALTSIAVNFTSAAREQANIAVCQSNIRQLRQAMSLYEADYQGVPVHFPVKYYGQEAHWQEKLMPYIRSKAAFLCPSDPTIGISYSWGGWPCSYMYMYTMLWLGPRDQYRAPSTASPLFLDRQHEKTTSRWIVGRYNGSIKLEPIGALSFQPEDGLGRTR